MRSSTFFVGELFVRLGMIPTQQNVWLQRPKEKQGVNRDSWHNAGGNSDIIRTLNVPKHLKCFSDNYRPLIIEWSLSIQVSKNEIRQKGARHQENADPGGKSMSDRLIQGNGSSNKREIYLRTVQSQYIFYEQGSLGHYYCPDWG